MPAPIYLYTGPEFGKRNDAVEKIKASLQKKFGDIENHLFYATETPVSQVMTTLQDGVLFSCGTCVVLRGAEVIKKKEEIQMISSWLDSKPEENTCLILVSDEVSVDSKLEKIVPDSNKEKFWEMFENQKLPWVYDLFRKNGYTIEEDAAELILELVENNTESLRTECSRFFTVFPKNHEITAEDVDSILAHNREENAFTLFNKMTNVTENVEKRFETALGVLQKIRMSKDNSSVALIAGLSSCFRKLQLWHKMLAENPYPDNFEMKKNGFSSKPMQTQYRNAAKIWTTGQAAAILALLSASDMEIRSGGSLVEDIILQKMLYEIIVKKGAGSAVWEED